MKHHPKQHHPTLNLPLEDAPRLVPYAGLPGTDGTSRFCYGFVTEAVAVATWARRHRKGDSSASVSGAAVTAPAEASARVGGAPGAPPNLAAPTGAPRHGDGL